MDVSGKNITIIGAGRDNTHIYCSNSSCLSVGFTGSAVQGFSASNFTISSCHNAFQLAGIIGARFALSSCLVRDCSTLPCECVVTQPSCDGSVQSSGAALYVTSFSSIDIFDTSFFNNTATCAAAIYTNSIETITILDSSFILQTGVSSFPILWINPPTSLVAVTIANSLFSEISTPSDVFALGHVSNLTIQNSTFTRIPKLRYLFLVQPALSTSTIITISNSIFSQLSLYSILKVGDFAPCVPSRIVFRQSLFSAFDGLTDTSTTFNSIILDSSSSQSHQLSVELADLILNSISGQTRYLFKVSSSESFSMVGLDIANISTIDQTILVSAAKITARDLRVQDWISQNGAGISLGASEYIIIQDSMFLRSTINSEYPAFEDGGCATLKAPNIMLQNSSWIQCGLRAGLAPPVSRGGAIVFQASGDIQSYITISDCLFCENHAWFYGGALSFKSPTPLLNAILYFRISISNSQFLQNSLAGGAGGAISCETTAELIIHSSFLVGNQGTAQGGAIYFVPTLPANFLVDQFPPFSLIIFNSTFSQNSGTQGGAIYTTVDTHIDDCKWTANVSPSGAVLFSPSKLFLSITNSVFSQHKATSPNALFMLGETEENSVDSPKTIIHRSIFANNNGSILASISPLEMSDSFFDFNRVDGASGLLKFTTNSSIFNTSLTNNSLVKSSLFDMLSASTGVFNLSFFDARFLQNTVASSALNFPENSKINMENCTIVGNSASAQSESSFIRGRTMSLNIVASRFRENSFQSVILIEPSSNITISDSSIVMTSGLLQCACDGLDENSTCEIDATSFVTDISCEVDCPTCFIHNNGNQICPALPTCGLCSFPAQNATLFVSSEAGLNYSQCECTQEQPCYGIQSALDLISGCSGSFTIQLLSSSTSFRGGVVYKWLPNLQSIAIVGTTMKGETNTVVHCIQGSSIEFGISVTMGGFSQTNPEHVFPDSIFSLEKITFIDCPVALMIDLTQTLNDDPIESQHSIHLTDINGTSCDQLLSAKAEPTSISPLLPLFSFEATNLRFNPEPNLVPLTFLGHWGNISLVDFDVTSSVVLQATLSPRSHLLLER